MKTNERQFMAVAVDATGGALSLTGNYGSTGGVDGFYVVKAPDGTMTRGAIIGTVTEGSASDTLSLTNDGGASVLISGALSVVPAGTITGTALFVGLATGDLTWTITGTASARAEISYGVSDRANSAAFQAVEAARTNASPLQDCRQMLANVRKAILALTNEGKQIQRVRYEDEEIWFTQADLEKLMSLYNRFYDICGTDEDIDLRLRRGRPARGYIG